MTVIDSRYIVTRLLVTIAALASVLLAGCIKNDIPYPHTEAQFLTIAAQGQVKAASIDASTATVTLYLGEEVDIKNVELTEFTLTEGAYVNGTDLTDGIDLSQPMEVTLTLYTTDYHWTIQAEQEIERYFTVAAQVGSSEIDVPARRVVAYVPLQASLAGVKVTSLKLGPAGAAVTPQLEGKTVDFSNPVEVTVSAYGRSETWTIYVAQTESTVSTDRVDAWTRVAWAYGTAQEGKNNGFQYREASATEWDDVPQDWITANGGSMTARLVHLKPDTRYVVRAYSDSDYGMEVEFTTGSVVQMPNSALDEWWKDGKIWCPWPEGGTPFWGTGNKGATTLGESNSIPTDDTSSGKGQAAKLETRFVGIGALGKIAAGNIFSGDYVKTDGTNGILSFGRPFTERPTRLTGYAKYTCVPISNSSSEMAYLKGRPDTAQIYIALADWIEPLEIRTNPKNRQLFDPADPAVIAYGTVLYGETIGEYQKFDITLDYRATDRTPRYILVVASASKYGDYFTGGNGSILWLDDLNLEYDY